MTTEEFKKIVGSIVEPEKPFGLEIYACVKELGNIVLKKIQVTDNLKKDLSKLVKNAVEDQLLADDVEIDSANNISDKRNVLREIPQTEKYHPFSFLDNESNIKECYTEANQGALIGYVFRINKNDDYFWLYQHLYPIKLLNRSKAVYAILNTGVTYTTLNKDIFRIEPRIDAAIIGESIFTTKTDLMQKFFGFDQYIKEAAERTIGNIKQMSLVKDTTKLEELLGKDRLTDAKKLMSAENSPVFGMDQSILCERLKKHSRYKDKFQYDDNMIIIETQKAASDFLKMLNDDIVKSELTDQEYDSHSKTALPPLKS